MGRTEQDVNSLEKRTKINILLKDLNHEILQRKVKHIEEHDKIRYRKTCFPYPRLERKPKSYGKEDSDPYHSSSDESIEYDDVTPYTMGSFGIIPTSVSRSTRRRKEPMKRLVSTTTCFDWGAAMILSEMGLLNKFERKGDFFVRKNVNIRVNRRYYVP